MGVEKTLLFRGGGRGGVGGGTEICAGIKKKKRLPRVMEWPELFLLLLLLADIFTRLEPFLLSISYVKFQMSCLRSLNRACSCLFYSTC